MKTRILKFTFVLCMALIVTGCAEIQLISHTTKRLFNSVKSDDPAPTPVPEIATIDEEPLSHENIIEFQTLLTENGFNTGGADGYIGPLTRKATLSYQAHTGIPEDGTPSLAMLEKLKNSADNQR